MAGQPALREMRLCVPRFVTHYAALLALHISGDIVTRLPEGFALRLELQAKRRAQPHLSQAIATILGTMIGTPQQLG